MKNFILSLLFLTCAFSAFSHPPKSITINTDLKTKSIKITVNHEVKNTEEHFISEIKVLLNGQEIEKITYTKQTSASDEILILKSDDLKEGDKIEVIAKCNKMGQKKSEIVVKNYYNQSKK